MVQLPHGLEVILHPLPHLLWELMQREEVLEVTPFCLVLGAPRVHALDDGRHIAEHNSVH
jgi:hypothetical protein